MKGAPESVLRLRRLWNEHVHRPFPGTFSGAEADARLQEVALYASWLGSIVEVALSEGGLDANHAAMLKTRRAEGNQVLFRAGGELGEPVRSYVGRLLAIEDLLAELPVE
ncbi:MAG: hypothetical protein NVS9B11_21300 [Candidatus Dormibacteraceae bacterium]